jgi:hypothetical protein
MRLINKNDINQKKLIIITYVETIIHALAVRFRKEVEEYYIYHRKEFTKRNYYKLNRPLPRPLKNKKTLKGKPVNVFSF